jgi:hypothetical protein
MERNINAEGQGSYLNSSPSKQPLSPLDYDPMDIDSPYRKDAASQKHAVAIRKLVIVA